MWTSQLVIQEPEKSQAEMVSEIREALSGISADASIDEANYDGLEDELKLH